MAVAADAAEDNDNEQNSGMYDHQTITMDRYLTLQRLSTKLVVTDIPEVKMSFGDPKIH
jgi:hypothetical protein